MTNQKKAVIIYHSFYGCETGCCGHRIEVGDEESFVFDHMPKGQDPREWAKSILIDQFSSEHIADLDWENCIVVSYGELC